MLGIFAVFATAASANGAGGLPTAYVFLTAPVAIGLWAAGVVGQLPGPLRMAERLCDFVAAALLVAAVPLTDQAGFALTAVLFAWHLWRHRRRARPPGPER